MDRSEAVGSIARYTGNRELREARETSAFPRLHRGQALPQDSAPAVFCETSLSALAGDHPNGAPYEWGLKLPLPSDFVRPVRSRSRLLLTSPSTEPAVSGAMN